jgi:hypothetical protein
MDFGIVRPQAKDAGPWPLRMAWELMKCASVLPDKLGAHPLTDILAAPPGLALGGRPKEQA